jgi:hypothetical protein
MALSLLLGKRPKSKRPEGRTLFRKHLSGFFGRPMPADRGWIIGNPKTAERQQRRIAFENICLHLVERVSCRMAYQRVIRRILKRRYAGNAGQDECVSIRIRQISVARRSKPTEQSMAKTTSRATPHRSPEYSISQRPTSGQRR